MNPQLPRPVITLMATRTQRMHHYLWHEVRNNWLRYPASTQQQIAAMGWQPPRPALSFSANGSRRVLRNNNSGEDFLFMHRRMIADVNVVLAQVADPKYPQVTGWATIPAPGDPDFPVPPAWDAGVQDVKSGSYYQKTIARWEQTFTDPTILQQLTLGQLGALIEFNIHNDLHMRWSAAPLHFRPPAQVTNPEGTIPTIWDDPSYDFLGDTYSSQVNPIFWKVHGWVDARIEDWKAAHGVTGEPAWIGTWMGAMSMQDMHHMHAHALHPHLPVPAVVREMEKVTDIIAQADVPPAAFPLDLHSELSELESSSAPI